MIDARLRFATPDDAAAVQAIYAPFCGDSPVSFEIVPPTVAGVRARMAKVLQRTPWLVFEENSVVAGYAYANPHRERAAYQWSVDVTVYIHDAFRRQGVGRSLYTALFALLRRQGFYNAYAGITLPNCSSVGLHESMQFRPVGIYQKVGFKCGQWHDVGWWALTLIEASPDPAPPTIWKDLSTQLRDEALRLGEAVLHRSGPGE